MWAKPNFFFLMQQSLSENKVFPCPSWGKGTNGARITASATRLAFHHQRLQGLRSSIEAWPHTHSSSPEISSTLDLFSFLRIKAQWLCLGGY